MASNNEGKVLIDSEILAGADKYYPYYHQNCTVSRLPRHCRFPHLMEMRGQGLDYSCSLEMSHLARAICGLTTLSDTEVARTIKLTTNGADLYDLYHAFRTWNIPCEASENVPVDYLRSSIMKQKSVFLWNGQQPYASKKDILNVKAGHYMMLCCGDNKYSYFADPGFTAGKTRVEWQYLPYVSFDQETATGRIVYGFVIEIMLLDAKGLI